VPHGPGDGGGRPQAELRTTTDELAASRAGIAAAGAAERRRVERDLHDGAQQQLIALQIKVALARELAPSDSEVAARLADVGYGLEDVLSELREFAHGAAPRSCATGG
jgi:signal transduction histidine kinase